MFIFDKIMATILVAPYLKKTTIIVSKKNSKEYYSMGMTELFVIAFLAMLGFLAFNNSRKVSKEIKKMSSGK
jgi:hypothetical protein